MNSTEAEAKEFLIKLLTEFGQMNHTTDHTAMQMTWTAEFRREVTAYGWELVKELER